MTMFVLSPLVAATKASARSMPAASSTRTSSAGPCTKLPGKSSPTRSKASALSSMTLTSCPSSMRPFATAEPTRPHPTTTTNTRASGSAPGSRQPQPGGSEGDEHDAHNVDQRGDPAHDAERDLPDAKDDQDP